MHQLLVRPKYDRPYHSTWASKSLTTTFLIIKVHHYDDRKRLYTAVYDPVSCRKRHDYDRKRQGNHSFGFHSITVDCRRAVYDDMPISFREKNVL